MQDAWRFFCLPGFFCVTVTNNLINSVVRISGDVVPLPLLFHILELYNRPYIYNLSHVLQTTHMIASYRRIVKP